MAKREKRYLIGAAVVGILVGLVMSAWAWRIINIVFIGFLIGVGSSCHNLFEGLRNYPK